MNFKKFCEENDSIMRELASALNKIERESHLFEDVYLEVTFKLDHQELMKRAEDTECDDVDSKIEEAQSLAEEEYLDYDVRDLAYDLDINTENVSWEFNDYYGRMMLDPTFSETHVSEFAESPLHIFDFATEQGLISINGANTDDVVTVLDYEDNFNHNDDVEFELSENIYKRRFHLEENPYKEDDEMWDEELKATRDTVEDIMHHLEPFLKTIDDLKRALNEFENGVEVDITDLAIANLEDIIESEDE